jgi:DUF1680 family protein
MRQLVTGTRAVVVDTAGSPHARLAPVPLDAVSLEDGYWKPRRELNRNVVIPGQFRLCEETGRLDNLRIAGGLKAGTFKGWFFNDSDVYKTMEAAAWQLATDDAPELDTLLDDLTSILAAAQDADGYLNSYFTGERERERWTNFDLHEMYCAGHLIQAAVAYQRATGKTALLGVAARFADHICARFGLESEGKIFGTDGHPELEMALVELYRATGERRYLDQAQYFIDARGYKRLNNRPFGHQSPVYHQDHLPFRELTRLEGHAVRAVYLNCGAADVLAETGEGALREALERMWESMTARQMYINGGLGARYENEGFGRDYELPNTRAHAETCASVASVMWNWRMLMIEPQASYADVMEHALFNTVMAGISLDGGGYFYQNPLSDDGTHRRQRWFSVACCPGNVARVLAQLPGYLYSVSDEGVWAHLYAASSAELPLPDGRIIRLRQRTDYPWSGDITFTTQTAGTYSLFLRLPGWVLGDVSLAVNDQPKALEMTAGGYIAVRRDWQPGDTVRLSLPMPVERVECHPFVGENWGRVALMRGPLLYCLEGVDNPDADVRVIGLPDDAELIPEFVPELLSGVMVLRGTGAVLDDLSVWGGWWGDMLYRRAAPRSLSPRLVPITAIPYYAWANRDAAPMQVWLRRG